MWRGWDVLLRLQQTAVSAKGVGVRLEDVTVPGLTGS
jgi:hypothetical protein